MNILITEDFRRDTTENRGDATPSIPTVPVQRQGTQPTLTEPLDAFLRDRFTTTIEDPPTGQWIGSCAPIGSR